MVGLACVCAFQLAKCQRQASSSSPPSSSNDQQLGSHHWIGLGKHHKLPNINAGHTSSPLLTFTPNTLIIGTFQMRRRPFRKKCDANTVHTRLNHLLQVFKRTQRASLLQPTTYLAGYNVATKKLLFSYLCSAALTTISCWRSRLRGGSVWQDRPSWSGYLCLDSKLDHVAVLQLFFFVLAGLLLPEASICQPWEVSVLRTVQNRFSLRLQGSSVWQGHPFPKVGTRRGRGGLLRREAPAEWLGAHITRLRAALWWYVCFVLFLG